MVDPFFGSLLGAGSSILGGILGNDAAKEASDQEWKRQKKVLQNSISWRVADAQRSGIHPVYALGAPTMNYAPSMAGDGGLGAGIANAGNTLGAAISNRASGVEKALAALQLENMGLQNDLLRSQIRRANSPGSVGGNPIIPGSNISGGVRVADDTFQAPDGDPNANQKIQNAFGDIAAAVAGLVDFGKSFQRKVEGPMPAFAPFNPWRLGTMSSQILNDLLKRAVQEFVQGGYKPQTPWPPYRPGSR